MTDKIPDDLRDKAKEVMTANGFENAQDDTFVTFFVERAIAAERERCAKISDEVTRGYCRGDFVMMGPQGIGRSISRAIRSPS